MLLTTVPDAKWISFFSLISSCSFVCPQDLIVTFCRRHRAIPDETPAESPDCPCGEDVETCLRPVWQFSSIFDSLFDLVVHGSLSSLFNPSPRSRK